MFRTDGEVGWETFTQALTQVRQGWKSPKQMAHPMSLACQKSLFPMEHLLIIMMVQSLFKQVVAVVVAVEQSLPLMLAVAQQD